jgi:hypothetical protein
MTQVEKVLHTARAHTTGGGTGGGAHNVGASSYGIRGNIKLFQWERQK